MNLILIAITFILIAMILNGCADNLEVIAISSKSKDGCECNVYMETPIKHELGIYK